eukprot:CAMPEP_0181178416 /NCGR_PEP_ID=MMETSP1096-20121128/5712_1 /TAXON_ID=156174 ORGANISM="Chrysochromulina ericina, Strain CCMP281" /NCGR_SAMPLE_ID=MMETSP1096 /ASSEMBLY_ACC=CAM_ASM_000453 /LENGTH=253 /DNA_ID=CAMNT_0023266691 /DNA_START=47 /DNA_END=805 /DNA_ORIENTATION=+
MKLPILTNGFAGRGSASMPVPDFSWVGWNKHTPPWCELHAQMAAAGQLVPWPNRTQLAYFSGGMQSGNSRKELKALYDGSQEARRLLKVRDVSPSFYTLSARDREGKDSAEPLARACAYSYLLSVPGFGYSNRLKALLLCGSPVIHIDAGSPREFFMPLLQPDRHFIVVARTKQVIQAVQRLRANATLARKIGRAGRRLALSQLTMERALGYLRALFASYSSIQRERVDIGDSASALDAAGYRQVDSVAAAAA